MCRLARFYTRLFTLTVVFIVADFLCSTSEAAIESRNTLKTYFETGDIPTEAQFDNLIDSFISVSMDYGPSITEHMMSLLTSEVSIGIAIDASGNPLRLDPQGSFDPNGATLASTVSLGAGSGWPGESGFLPFLLELDDAGLTTIHAGFIQISVDESSSASPYAIRISGAAYETTPRLPITVFSIPEPSAMTLYFTGLSLLGIFHRASRRITDS